MDARSKEQPEFMVGEVTTIPLEAEMIFGGADPQIRFKTTLYQCNKVTTSVSWSKDSQYSSNDSESIYEVVRPNKLLLGKIPQHSSLCQLV